MSRTAERTTERPRFTTQGLSSPTTTATFRTNVIPVYSTLVEVRCSGKYHTGRNGQLLGKFDKGTKGEVMCPDTRCKHLNKIEVK